VGLPPSHSATPPLLIKFDVHNITLNLYILSITPEKDLNAPLLPLPPFPPQLLPQSTPLPMTSAASSGNGRDRQRRQKQRQRRGNTTINQQMAEIATETAFVAAAAATVAAMAAAVVTVAIAATAGAQTVAAAMAALEIYIKKGLKWRSWRQW